MGSFVVRDDDRTCERLTVDGFGAGASTSTITVPSAKRKAAGFTILATLDPSIAPKEDIQIVVGVFDGVVEVYERMLQERTRRFLTIKKMYSRDYLEEELIV